MNTKTIVSISLITFVTGCGSTNQFLQKISPFKQEEDVLEPQKGATPLNTQKSEDIFVCAGDIDTAYKKLGAVSLGEFGFSGHDILALKIREKARAVGAQAVINVQYDTGASKSWQGYGELGGTDYGIKYTSWCKGTAIVILESYNSLGFLTCNLTKENREWFGLKKVQNGVLVVSIQPGSIAANTGIQVEDLITELNGEKVENKKQLAQLIQSSAGKEAKFTLLHAGEVKTAALSIPVSTPDQATPPSTPPSLRENKPTTGKEAAPQIAVNSDNADVHNEIGDLYLRKGMYDEAIKEYKKAIETDPNCAIAHFNLSIVYDKKGMKEEAEREFATYKKLKPKRN